VSEGVTVSGAAQQQPIPDAGSTYAEQYACACMKGATKSWVSCTACGGQEAGPFYLCGRHFNGSRASQERANI
jgi:hypothetical protein